MKRLLISTPLFVLAFAVATASTETTPTQVHRALEAKQRIQERVQQALGSDSSRGEQAHGSTAPGARGHVTAGAHKPGVDATTPDGHAETDVWAELLAGNERFVSGRTRPRTVIAQRAALVAGQHPRAIVLACADSRVGPELLFDQSLGDLFVVRNAGNLADPIVIGSIEYAVEHLHSQLIVVLGHASCGAVKAACSKDDMPSPNLTAVVQEIRPTAQRLSSCFDGAELVDRTVRANARHTAEQLVANSTILREAVAAGHVKVVSAYYDLATGKVSGI